MQSIPYGRQSIDNDDIKAVVDVLKSDWLTQGSKVHEFEEKVASYHNCKYAVSFSNGTAALHGAYYVSTKFPFGKKGNTVIDLNKVLRDKGTLNHGSYDLKNLYWEFITTPITFSASANAGLYCGGSPRFVDIDISTYCIDINQIEDQITDDTRVITPVSYAGYPVDIQAIRNLQKVRDNNLCIIHDACHAIGARRDHHGIADFADMTILSFHPVKHITTGEGGMVLTNNEDYYKKLLLFRNHGITKDVSQFTSESEGDWYYEMQELGYNYRLTDIQCAIGITQVEKLDNNIYIRNSIAKFYKDELKTLDWLISPPGFQTEFTDSLTSFEAVRKTENLHAYHLYVLLVREREIRKEFYNYMRLNGIFVQVHYIPVHRQPYYTNKGQEGRLVESSYFYDRCVSIPMFPTLTQNEMAYVIEKIKGFKKY